MSERMNIVIVGHVDHGKSTLVGRLMVDTGSLPEGKLEQVRRTCEINSKPFEYAFLLDALIDEQSQGITIDTARIFFKSKKREYIIIDAPGHIEFLKNMISGAARAEAAILLIDAAEGIAENSKRHAYMLSMLGIKQVVVAINKMDLVNFSEEVYNTISKEYSKFLLEIGIRPVAYIPISARDGVNITGNSDLIPWYKGLTIVELLDEFKKEKEDTNDFFRMFVQGVYKFTANGDDRRIIAGTIDSGKIHVGDDVVFLPSGKRSTVKTIELYGQPNPEYAEYEQAIGLTLTTQIYVKASELMYRADEQPPYLTDRFRANIFWMGRNPLVLDKKYKIKLGTLKVDAFVEKIENVLDASVLENSSERQDVARHEVARVIFRTTNLFCFDKVSDNKITSRFVVVDGYDIAGGGIVIDELPIHTEPAGSPDIAEFEKELKLLIRKYFPHWELNI